MKGNGLQVALLGNGAMATLHAAALPAAGCTIAAVMGPIKEEVEAFSLAHGIDRFTTELKEVLDDDDIDAVVIASPNAVHAQQAIAAAEMGKHVLCEVPLATSYDDAERVVAAVRSTGIVAMVCQTQRFLPPVDRLRRLVKSGELDPLHIASFMALRRRQNENVGFMGASRRWIDDIIWHHGSHAIDTALWLLDDEIQVIQATSGRPDPANGRALDVSIALRTQSGRLASMLMSYSSLRLINEITLIGESATYRIADGISCDEPGPAADGAGLETARNSAIHAQDEIFIRSILGESAPHPTPAELLPVLAILREVESQIDRSFGNANGGTRPVGSTGRIP